MCVCVCLKYTCTVFAATACRPSRRIRAVFAIVTAWSNNSCLSDTHPCQNICQHTQQVATAHLESIATKWDFNPQEVEPLVQTCMTTLSSKV